MENCLVTKLKGVVDNENLLPLGTLVLGVHKVESPDIPNTTLRLLFYCTQPGVGYKVKAVGGTFSVNGETYTEYTPQLQPDVTNYTLDIELENKDYKIELIGAKYKIYTLNALIGSSSSYKSVLDLDVSALQYSPIYDILFNSGYTNSAFLHGEFLAYDFDNVHNVNINASDVIFELDNFTNNAALINFQVPSCEVHGSILNLVKAIGCGNFNFVNCGNGITGSIDDFAAAQVADGRTSGTVNFKVLGCPNITCSVQSENKQYRITYDSSYTGGYQITTFS